jgi:hypothetical protein
MTQESVNRLNSSSENMQYVSECDCILPKIIQVKKV